MNKSEIRATFLNRRSALTQKEQTLKSKKIIKHLESIQLFKDAKNILFYYSLNSEVETHDLIKRWIDRKGILLPRLFDESTFVALPVNSLEKMECNRFGIPEPSASKVKSGDPDLIIVPGVAFDRRGNRIGMGKGYYDRFLSHHKGVPRVALAYSEQILESIPKEPYDEKVDWIITENELIRC